MPRSRVFWLVPVLPGAFAAGMVPAQQTDSMLRDEA